MGKMRILFWCSSFRFPPKTDWNPSIPLIVVSLPKLIEIILFLSLLLRERCQMPKVGRTPSPSLVSSSTAQRAHSPNPSQQHVSPYRARLQIRFVPSQNVRSSWFSLWSAQHRPTKFWDLNQISNLHQVWVPTKPPLISLWIILLATWRFGLGPKSDGLIFFQDQGSRITWSRVRCLLHPTVQWTRALYRRLGLGRTMYLPSCWIHLHRQSHWSLAS